MAAGDQFRTMLCWRTISRMSERKAPQIVELDTAISTQAVARSLLGTDPCPDVVLAATQTAGRGRCGRSWISPIGGMYATLIVPTTDLLFARAALAVVKALHQTGIRSWIKWPNDLLVEGRKIAGLLIEVLGDRALVGVGINLDTSPVNGATCVGAHVDDPPCASALAVRVWQSWPDGAAEQILGDYRRQCATLGRWVRVDCGTLGGGSICGVAVNVDETGSLLLACKEDGEQTGITVTCGDCRHLRTQADIRFASRD